MKQLTERVISRSRCIPTSSARLANLEAEPAVAAAFIIGLASTFGARIAATSNHFDVARLQAACAVALLPMAASSTHCADAIMQLSK